MDKILTEEHIANVGLSGWLIAIILFIVSAIILPLIILGYKKFQNRKAARRARLYIQLKPIWDRNHQIFIEYGPHENNDAFYDLEGDATDEWRKKVKQIILPNHQKIRDICSENLLLMTEKERDLYNQYEDHVADFKSCHEYDYLPNRRFPPDVVTIFKD
ncbi:hypothetical protein RMB03_09860 [Acinetobacter sp. V91_7]|uniref:hypothetical protein n=1 Tax=Acinetobacter TaxID=469 RepID=UPI00287CB506|nr:MULTISPECIES: hypothetical protein [unclassified Acinetobacter]MDS7932676.1 hypothetical protein [Acinetobacter sp. V91_4B]MDS7963260.1 hypothetical protein [Acinetobacter sp. V91_7]MDS8028354.1 hypothetical protein [Acinetobacter sp. V91_13]